MPMNEHGAAKNYYTAGGAKNATAAATILRVTGLAAKAGPTLDIGCGDGSVLQALGARADLFGVDTSEPALQLARGRVPQATLVRGDVQAGLPFSDQSFGLVLMLDVLEHLYNPVMALGEVRRLLRDDGILVVTTPNANSPMRFVRGKKWFGVADPAHMLLFTEFTLSHLLERCGFRPVLRTVEAFTGLAVEPVLRFLKVGGTLLVSARKV